MSNNVGAENKRVLTAISKAKQLPQNELKIQFCINRVVPSRLAFAKFHASILRLSI